MKKIISIILSTIISALALTSCADNTITTTDTAITTGQQTPIKRDYTVYLTDFSDDISGGKKDDITLTWKEEIKNPVPNEKLQIDSKAYQGTYKYTNISPYYGLDRDIYIYEDNVVEIEYSINTKTQKVDSYSVFYNEKRDFSGRKVYSKDECIAMAKEYLKQYIHSIDKYDLVSDDAMVLPSRTVYYLIFQERIGDVYIANRAQVSINMCGDINYLDYSFGIDDVEAFKESGYLETIDFDAIDKAIEKRVCDDFLSSGYYDKCVVVNNDEYKTTKTLVKMADGRYALIGEVHVSCNGRTPSDVSFFIYLD